MAENKVLTMNGQEKPETLAIFLDFANIDFAFRQLEKEWSPEWLKEYLTEGRKLAEAFCYLGLNPHNLAGSQRFASHLRACGYFVRTKVARVTDNGSLECDLDIDMVLDVMDFAREVRPDIIVLATGDGDFASVARRLRLLGIRVEIAATQGNVSRDLLEAANGFIDLEIAINEIKEADGGEAFSSDEEDKSQDEGVRPWNEDDTTSHKT